MEITNRTFSTKKENWFWRNFRSSDQAQASGSVTAQTPVDQLSTVGEPVQPSQSAPGHGLGRVWPHQLVALVDRCALAQLLVYQAQECMRTWLYSCYYMYNVPCAHAPGTGRSHERIFSLCGGVHDVATAKPFWKTCSQKSGSIPFSIQPFWEVCKCLRCLQSRSASDGGAKRKADDSRRETGNGENEEEVEMMLSAEASLEEKDKRLARSSFVVDKRGLEEGRHRLLSENVR